MTTYTATWNLPQGPFSVAVEAEDPTEAAEHLFNVCNNAHPDTEDGQRWAAVKHRSMSVGDRIQIDGGAWVCRAVGWGRGMSGGTEDYSVAPGELITEWLQENGHTNKWLATQGEWSQKFISQLLSGQVRLTVHVADRVERITGMSAQLLLRMDADYQLLTYRQTLAPLGTKEASARPAENSAGEMHFPHDPACLFVTGKADECQCPTDPVPAESCWGCEQDTKENN